MDLRWYSFDWYAALGLPNEDITINVLKYQYGDWMRDDHLRIRLQFDITHLQSLQRPGMGILR
jgi:hypothetical protein